jgi:beta-glucanase (GH16 family)
MLPGSANVLGLWPAVWSMGNLGRVGYGASLEGMVRLSCLTYPASWLMNNAPVALHVRLL